MSKRYTNTQGGWTGSMQIALDRAVKCVLVLAPLLAALAIQASGAQSGNRVLEGSNVITLSTNCTAGEFINGTVCQNCPKGQYSTQKDSLTCQTCKPMDEACFYQDNCDVFPATIETEACVECADGHVGPGGDKPCTPCSAGRFVGSTASCRDCEVGTYGYSEVAKRSDGCLVCPEGFLTEGTGAPNVSSCSKPCDPGFEWQQRGQIRAECTRCPEGRFNDKPAQIECPLCPRGFYADNVQKKACTPCPPGTIHRDVTGATSEEIACGDSCGPGFRIHPQNINCTACALGKYQPKSVSTTCFDCPPGTEGLFSASVSYKNCSSCGSGKFSPTGGSSQCLSCPLGQSTEGVNATNTFDPVTAARYDDIGSVTVTGFRQCLPCSVGFFADNQGSGICEPCLQGKTTNSTGAISISDCFDCGLGTFEIDGVCELCNLGTFGDSAGLFGSCKFCSAGRYQNTTGQTACLNCTAGFIPNPLDNGASISFDQACIEASPTPTATSSATTTPSVTPTQTGSPSATASVSSTMTTTPTATMTSSETASQTSTPTGTSSQTSTPTSTSTGTVSPTSTSSGTPSESSTPTGTSSPTSTGSSTSTSTGTSSPSESPSMTQSPVVRGGLAPDGDDTWIKDEGLPYLLSGLLLLLLLCLLFAFLLVRRRRKKKEEEEVAKGRQERTKTTVEAINPLQEESKFATDTSNPDRNSKNSSFRSKITQPISNRQLHGPQKLGKGFDEADSSGRSLTDFNGDKRGFVPSQSRSLVSSTAYDVENPLDQAQEEPPRKDSKVKQQFKTWFGRK